MLHLWSFSLALSLVLPQQTTATTTAEPSAQNNDFKILTLTTTDKTIQLRLQDDERVLRQTPLLTSTPSKESFIEEDSSIATTTTTTPITTSTATLASSNAPATITYQAKEAALTIKTLNHEEETTAAIEQLDTNEEKPTITIATTTTTSTKQHKNNQNKLKEEIKETDLKQVTESVDGAQQQQITTDAGWQKETDMHIQSTGNARYTQNDIKITATIRPTTFPSAITTTATFTQQQQQQQRQLHNDNDDDDAAAVVQQNLPDHVEQKEIVGDSITFPKVIHSGNLQPVKQQVGSITLTLAKDKQGIADFKPIIREANNKLLRERTIFSSKTPLNNEEWKQNLMPNELEYESNKALNTKTFKHNINWSPYLHPATTVTDFTGKLLQEQDGVITEIEQKFRLNEFVADGDTKPTITTLYKAQTTSSTKEINPSSSFSVNHEILDLKRNPIIVRAPVEFIERRVKKSFDFPMHRVASDALHMPQHFDFANTKFNSNNNEQLDIAAPKTTSEGQQVDSNSPVPRPQPEFSTTKFYNSKELYNEMLQHKTKQLQQQQQLQPPQHSNVLDKDLEELKNRPPSLALNSFAVLHSPKMAKLEEIHELKEPQQQKSLAIKKVTVKATKHKELMASSTTATKTTARDSATTIKPTTTTITTTTSNTPPTPTKDFSTATTTEISLAALVKTKKFQKELNRAKLLIKSMMPLQNATTTTNKNTNNSSNEFKVAKETTPTNTFHTQTEIPNEKTTNTPATTVLITSTTRPVLASSNSATTFTSTTTTTTSSSAEATILSASSTNPSKTSLRPIVRPRILSRLQEKINSLECELQNLPQDSHLWRGNETHELLLPIMTPENCKTDKDCTAMMVSWEGEAEIQSGDILIVEINDALLTPKDINLTTTAHNTQVYQVTRSGHEHCDVTEGILLDITPLIVDGRKLVTLYDKDLTEGVNLLIVVSELWGTQCVRLKVTTKTENCGETADCSGKGICFSNYDMEEYECQCCSGFAGPHCEEIDACTPSPCTNNGICVDLSQGHEGNSYQCLCPYGYTGKNCQYELDPCNPAECMNGGSCVGNSTHFRCDCTPGYTGPLCQHSLNECESSPCIHGICVDQEDGFRCFCQPGFAGELCNFEYNECESNPCQNGGECIDHIGSYECHCTKGYTGNRCQIKVDFCANKPCPEGRRCIDHGNDYSCECLGGRNGPDCNEMQRTQCNVNPCTHGGTCWSSGDSFYCACRAGYTGTMCEDEFVVETVVSSSEFMVDDTSARNFNDKSFGSSVVLKSPIELHNAYTAAIVLALVIFFVALYLTICHCKVNQTYRKFSTRTYSFLPILGFRLRTKQATSKISRHWLSGKGLGIGNAMRGTTTSSSTAALHATATSSSTASSQRNGVGHLPTAKTSSATKQQTHVGQLNERPFQRHLAMNLENDMYYTVDFSENSQHSPLIQ